MKKGESNTPDRIPSIISGVQPTGSLTIGNYLGAIKNCVDIQEKSDLSLFFVADMHAITMPHNASSLKESVIRNTAYYIASGIDPKKSIVFRQSSLGEYHSYLAWIIGCYAKMGWLDRMTQFKEKSSDFSRKNKGLEVGFGLYAYPVLMAADILLYGVSHVPAGDDQKQHIEFARDLAKAFNYTFDTDVLNMPDIIMVQGLARIMSLRDGKKKMSKSDPSDESRINLHDPDDSIVKKIRHAKTDSESGIWYDPENRPEISNMMRLYAGIDGLAVGAVEEECRRLSTLDFKTRLAEKIVNMVRPIRDEANRMCNEPGYINNVLLDGQRRAEVIAADKLRKVREVVGLI